MIVASLATIPSRDVRATADSLKNQVDVLCINHNLTSVANAMYGDAAKFLPFRAFEGYMFSCDDDLIYPADYVRKMIEAIERYGRQAIITCHGRTFPKRQIKSYYRDKLQGYRCLGTVSHDVRVDSGGTGVMAWHSDTWMPDMGLFKLPNMADIWVAKDTKEKGIGIMCIAHEEGWIRYTHPGDTIWDRDHEDDSKQTGIWNSFWM